MKTIAMIILLIYQIILFIMQLTLKNIVNEKLNDRISFIVQIIPLAMCIILAM